MILVDSSVWIQFFRGGDMALVAKLGRLLDEDQVAVARGQRFGVGDLLIAGIAGQHAAEIWSLEQDFARMEKLGFIQRHR